MFQPAIVRRFRVHVRPERNPVRPVIIFPHQRDLQSLGHIPADIQGDDNVIQKRRPPAEVIGGNRQRGQVHGVNKRRGHHFGHFSGYFNHHLVRTGSQELRHVNGKGNVTCHVHFSRYRELVIIRVFYRHLAQSPLSRVLVRLAYTVPFLRNKGELQQTRLSFRGGYIFAIQTIDNAHVTLHFSRRTPAPVHGYIFQQVLERLDLRPVRGHPCRDKHVTLRHPETIFINQHVVLLCRICRHVHVRQCPERRQVPGSLFHQPERRHFRVVPLVLFRESTGCDTIMPHVIPRAHSLIQIIIKRMCIPKHGIRHLPGGFDFPAVGVPDDSLTVFHCFRQATEVTGGPLAGGVDIVKHLAAVEFDGTTHVLYFSVKGVL